MSGRDITMEAYLREVERLHKNADDLEHLVRSIPWNKLDQRARDTLSAMLVAYTWGRLAAAPS